jgi:hypothetical protein
MLLLSHYPTAVQLVVPQLWWPFSSLLRSQAFVSLLQDLVSTGMGRVLSWLSFLKQYAHDGYSIEPMAGLPVFCHQYRCY